MGFKKGFAALTALLLAAVVVSGAFAKGQGEKAAGPMRITWAGLALQTKGGQIYPKVEESITQELNKALGIELVPVKSDTLNNQQMTLLFASGEFPDQVLASRDNMIKWTDQGLFRKVPDAMIKAQAPTYYADYLNGIIGAYSKQLPSWDAKTSSWIGLANGIKELEAVMVVRTDWLRKVGAKMPTTTAEYEQVVKLFTENDPDGNGKKDTYGLGTGTGYWTINLNFLLASFGYETPNAPVLGKDGKVTFQNITEGYKDFLKYISGLYGKGYMYPDITLPDRVSVGTLFTDGIIGTIADTWTWVLPKYRQGSWFDMTFEKNPKAEFEYVPQLAAPGYTPTWEERAAIWMYHCIGKDVKDAKLAKILQVIDIQLKDKYYHNLVWSGIEGKNFKFDAQGMRQFIGDYVNVEKQGELGSKYYLTNIKYGWMLGASFGKAAETQAALESSWKSVQPVLGFEWVLDSQKKVGADVGRVFEEYTWKAITGKANFTSDWDAYVKNWLSGGGQQMIDEANKKYNALPK
jgi:putative aldouronate transport system substrate-binding protein